VRITILDIKLLTGIDIESIPLRFVEYDILYSFILKGFPLRLAVTGLVGPGLLLPFEIHIQMHPGWVNEGGKISFRL
jgi:hypothetical protein